jgi:hypothetical protein
MTGELDRWFPKRGQCQVCGTPGLDQGHRILDVIAEQAATGELAEDIAEELMLPVEAVRVAIAEWVP